MDPNFWQERWQNNQIGFHQGEPNKLLMKHWPKIASERDAGLDVFVPLCGKSLDMIWLAEKAGCRKVVGVELSRLAIAQFFSENGFAVPAPRSVNGFEVFESGPYELWCGDFFAFPADRLARVNACYDRASLIALPQEMRVRYAEKLSAVLPPLAETLLLTISYDPAEMNGPPFSVPDTEVHELFALRRRVECLEARDGLEGAEELRKRGLTALTASVFLIGEAVS